MFFSSDTKKELVQYIPEKKCCMLAEIAGFIRMCGSIGLIGGGKMKLAVNADSPATARLMKKMIKQYFDVDTNVEIIKNTTFKRNRNYRLNIIDPDSSGQMLREAGILMVQEGSNVLREGIPFDIIKKKCCKRAYLRGLFLGSGTISDPEKGYHLEIVCSNEFIGNDVKKLMNSLGLNGKVIRRRNQYVVYIKESEQIVDFLNLTGAYSQLLSFENVRIFKEIKNKTNRIVNCENANVDKAVDAAARHIESIKFIEKTAGLEALPERLQVMAAIRLENPSANLKELAELMDPPISKSGVNHRLTKIQEFADRLREEQGCNPEDEKEILKGEKERIPKCR